MSSTADTFAKPGPKPATRPVKVAQLNLRMRCHLCAGEITKGQAFVERFTRVGLPKFSRVVEHWPNCTRRPAAPAAPAPPTPRKPRPSERRVKVPVIVLKTQGDPYLNGWTARERGYPVTRNPYREGTENRELWETGWNDPAHERVAPGAQPVDGARTFTQGNESQRKCDLQQTAA